MVLARKRVYLDGVTQYCQTRSWLSLRMKSNRLAGLHFETFMLWALECAHQVLLNILKYLLMPT